MKFRILAASAFISLMLGLVFGGDVTPQGRLTSANEAYEKGDLSTAETTYLELVGQGYEGVSLYYNLGNLYYLKGERGKSVLWYERAKRLSPRDSDIAFNLSLARSHIKEQQDHWTERILMIFTNNELGWSCTVLSWVFFFVLGFRLLGRVSAQAFWATLVLWISGPLLVVSVLWFGLQSALWFKPIGIVTDPPGEVRNGPGADYSVGFTLPLGSRVIVLEKRPEWVQIGVIENTQGFKGWIPSKEVELISARRSNLHP